MHVRKSLLGNGLPYGWLQKLNTDGVEVFYEEATGKETLTDPRLAFSKEPKDSLYDFTQKYDASSTSLQILNGVDLTNKVAIVTGCNTGIGFETARSLALHGCEVIFACRSKESATTAMQRIISEKANAKCVFYELDLCSLASVKTCSSSIRLNYDAINMIILNAGIFGAPFKLTEDNYDQTFQTNHLAQFYFTLLLKPIITARSSSRIIILSSESHRVSRLTEQNISWDYLSPKTSKTFIPFMAYNDSKLCNMLFAFELNRRWSRHGVTANAVHPGNLCSSDISRNWWFYRILFFILRPFTKSMQQASATTIWAAAADELEGVSGQYMNNCWLSNPSDKAKDTELAKKLWDISIEMIEKIVAGVESLNDDGDVHY